MNVNVLVMNDDIRVEVLSGPTHGQDPDGWKHWSWTLRLHNRQGRTIDTPWKAGAAITGEPEAADVLRSLIEDARGVVAAEHSFEVWADDYGYDSDSRKAEAIYRACEATVEPLVAFLGIDGADHLFDIDTEE